MKSLWIDSEKDILENNKKLEGIVESDVCIIGGGITGISTGYYLSKNGKKVVIVEREKIGTKTTGNTTGKITSQHGLFYKYLIDDYGKDYAKKYYNANQEAIENISNIIKEENIDCNFERQSAYVFTRNQEELQKIKDEVSAVEGIGGETKFLENIEIPIKNVLGAIEFPNQAEFNVMKYIKGLAKVIIENKGEIYEKSKVCSIKNEDYGYRIYTENGRNYKIKICSSCDTLSNNKYSRILFFKNVSRKIIYNRNRDKSQVIQWNVYK